MNWSLFRRCTALMILGFIGVVIRPVQAQMVDSCVRNPNDALCRVARDWTIDAVDQLLDGETSRVIADESAGEITFLFRGEANEVLICCGIQERLEPVERSDRWALTLRIQNLSQAVIEYQFIPTTDDTGWSDITLQSLIWRGSEAPPPPEQAELLAGRLEEHTLESAAIGEPRGITVYLPLDHDPESVYPVIYAADGQAIASYAQVIEPLMRDEVIPPLVIIGVHSAQQPDNRATRADEYLPNFRDGSEANFAAHETFFTEEVRLWAEETFGASTARQYRIVFGYSNGGVFAIAMGYRHPELYAHIFGFSPGISPGSLDETAESQARYYLAAGTLEDGFAMNTTLIAGYLRSNGIDVVDVRRISGHDFIMWMEVLPDALRWAFDAA